MKHVTKNFMTSPIELQRLLALDVLQEYDTDRVIIPQNYHILSEVSVILHIVTRFYVVSLVQPYS